MEDGIKAFGALALVTLMLATTVLMAMAPARRSWHGAQLLGVRGDCVTLLAAGEMHTVCGVRP